MVVRKVVDSKKIGLTVSIMSLLEAIIYILNDHLCSIALSAMLLP
jgi:hypothetical protein